MSKTFCIAPWHDTHIVTDGGFKGCCVMSQGPLRGRFHTDGKPVTIRDGIKAGINSDTAKELRLASLNGEWHPECKRCMDEEMSGMKSMRQFYDERWNNKFTFDDAVEITDPETGSLSDDFMPFYYDIQLGNLCNLKCRICSPLVSSSWIPDEAKMRGSKTFTMNVVGSGKVTFEHESGKQFTITPDPFAWANSEEFWQQMSSIKHKIDHLYLIGGEPMMIHRHFKFLKECIDSGDAKRMTLQYDTNLTNLPQKVMEYWKEFKVLEIGFSIDGMGPELEYMRHPIKWDHMLKNINRLEEFAKENDNVKITDSVTVSIYNVIHILDYIEWKIKEGKYTYTKFWQRHSPHFGVHPLHGPDFLCVKTMPKSAKATITQKYKDWAKKMSDWCDSIEHYTGSQTQHQLKNNINTYVDTWIKFINQDDWSKNMYKFWDFTNELDEIRGENFESTFPELYGLLQDYQSKPDWWFLPTERFNTE